ncbi:hypothetical protein H4R34_000154 [Dimargaris verticillata]|uniref:WD40-repeat-containing domain protein n=1 Tax=Dimargaris verticillata TaxID=2761393 RepID=A0A9W8BCD1_9FUNG|nr:hypothetical protein H4R34_000154 [Dimargaris verticillata]
MASCSLTQHLAQRALQARPSTAHTFPATVAGHPTVVDKLRVSQVLDGGHTGCVNTVQWSSTGRFLLSGSDDTQLCLWNAEANYALVTRCATGHTANIFSAEFMPKTADSVVVSCAGDGQIRVFDLHREALVGSVTSMGPTVRTYGVDMPSMAAPTAAPSFQLQRVYTCHNDRVKRIALENDNPHVFLTCGEDGRVRQFDLRLKSHHTLSEGDSTACTSWLVDYQRYGIDLYGLALNQWDKHYLVTAGTHPYVFLHDRRMLPAMCSTAHGLTNSPLHQPNKSQGMPAQSILRFKPRAVQGSSQIVHPTAVRFSSANRRELLASWSSEHIYLFDIHQGQGVPPPATGGKRTVGTCGQKPPLRPTLPTGSKPLPPQATAAPHPAPASPPASSPALSSAASSPPRPSRIQFSFLIQGRTRSASSPPVPTTASATVSSNPAMVRVSPPQRGRSSTSSSSSLAEASGFIQHRTRQTVLTSFVRGEPGAGIQIAELLAQTQASPSHLNSSPQAGLPMAMACANLPVFDHMVKAMVHFRELQPFNQAHLTSLPNPDGARIDEPWLPQVPLDVFCQVGSTLDHISRALDTASAWPYPNTLGIALRGLLGWYRAQWQLREPIDREADHTEMARQHLGRSLQAMTEAHRYALQWQEAYRTDGSRETVHPMTTSALPPNSATVLQSPHTPAAAGVPLLNLHPQLFGLDSALLDTFVRSTQSAVERTRTLLDQMADSRSPPGSLHVLPASAIILDFTIAPSVLQLFGLENDPPPTTTSLPPMGTSVLPPLPHSGASQLTSSSIATSTTARSSRSRLCQEIRPYQAAAGSTSSLASSTADPTQPATSPIQPGYDWPWYHPSSENSTESDADMQIDSDTPFTDTDSIAPSGSEDLGSDSAVDGVSDSDPPLAALACDATVPVQEPIRSFRGHANIETVKDVNFFGTHDEYVISGSDDGNLFLWDKATGKLRLILQGDRDVVNVTQGHPFQPTIAVSGIDNTIKLVNPFAHPQNARADATLDFDRQPGTDSSYPSLFARMGPPNTALNGGGGGLWSWSHDVPEDQTSPERFFPYFSRNLIHRQSEIIAANESHRSHSYNYSLLTRNLLTSLMGHGFIRQHGWLDHASDSDAHSSENEELAPDEPSS